MLSLIPSNEDVGQTGLADPGRAKDDDPRAGKPVGQHHSNIGQDCDSLSPVLHPGRAVVAVVVACVALLLRPAGTDQQGHHHQQVDHAEGPVPHVAVLLPTLIESRGC